MQTVHSIGPLRAFLIRSRLFCRYVRLWAMYRRQRRALSLADKKNEKKLHAAQAKHDKEILRKDEMVAALQTKVEIIQRESTDRVFEAMKLIGTSYATREADQRLQDARYRPIDEAKRRNPNKSDLYNSLTADARIAYDDEYEAHANIGKAQGLDQATIDRFWRDNEEAIVGTISGEIDPH